MEHEELSPWKIEQLPDEELALLVAALVEHLEVRVIREKYYDSAKPSFIVIAKGKDE